MGPVAVLRPGRHVLLWLTLALVPASAFTALVAKAFEAKHHALAAEWLTRGSAAMKRGRADEAVRAFRTALAFNRADRTLRLRLAEALIAAGQPAQARSYLLNLWEEQPGNGAVNLQLARLAARDGDVAAAIRYYHHAVEGAWLDRAEEWRRTARLELSEFLVREGVTDAAQAELIRLSGDASDDPAIQERVAGLLMAVDLPRRALTLYDGILRSKRADGRAAYGAGMAALAVRDDSGAERYLVRAVQAEPGDQAARHALETVRLMTSIDPFGRRLSARERARRVLRAIDAAAARLQRCPAGPAESLQGELTAARATIVPRWLADEPERVDAAMDVVFRAERLAEDGCGEPAAIDRALLVLAGRREESPS